MESALSILLWVGLIFLMMRFGCGSHMFGHGHKKGHEHPRSGNPAQGRSSSAPALESNLRWEAPDTDADPVCGKTIATSGARSSVYDGLVYYFCSRECREAFEALPSDYAGAKAEHEPRRLDHIPVKGESHG